MFEKRKAHKLEARHQREAGAEAEREQKDALEELGQLARTLPDEHGVVSVDGFQKFFQIVIDHDIALRDHPDLRDPILLGLAQGGHFLARETTLILKKDEAALWDEPASLLKEVTDREFRAGSQGLSIPIGGGVRYRVGQTRGHVVTIGTHWATADTGTLTLTDDRIVYHGARKTLEFPFKKLATLNVYSDAIDLGVTSRQTTPSFRLADPTFVAGMVHAALDHADDGVTLIRTATA
jgi:hypothetical protein